MIVGIANIKNKIIDSAYNDLIEKKYKNFIIKSNDYNTDLKTSIHYQRERFIEDSKPLFETSNWSVYKKNKRYVIPFFNDSDDKFPCISLTADNSFNDIQVVVHIPNVPEFVKLNEFNPLSFPLDEIVFINHLGKNKKGLLVHAAGIISDGKGYLFPGISTAGKSTISKLFLDYNKAVVLSDDRIVIRKIDEKYFIYGTPWHGEADINANEKAPLNKIFFLEKGEQNSLRELSLAEKFQRLFQCTFLSFWDSNQVEYAITFYSSLIKKINMQIFSFIPNKLAVDFIMDETEFD